MLGGTRNGRAVKLALLVGAVLLVLYFLISWRVEAQTLSKDLATAEEEYVKVLKQLHRMENELKDSVKREAKMEDSLREERQTLVLTKKAKQELEAKCKADLEAKKKQVAVLEGEKNELQEQIQAVKADRDSKSQEAQRLTEELHDAKEAADDEYQALSATCVQNQQTCERRAKQAEESLATATAQATTNYQSLQECKQHLASQLEATESCNTQLTSLKREGAGRLSEIEQIQSQLHHAQQDNEKLMAQVHHKQQNAQVDQSKLQQPNDNNNIGGQSLQKQQLQQGFDNGGGNFHHRVGGGGGGDVGERIRRDDGNFGGGQSLRGQVDKNGANSWRDGFRGIGNQGEQFQRVDNRFQNPGARGDLPGIDNRGDQFHGMGNQNGQYHGIGNQNDQLHGLRNRDDHFQDRARDSQMHGAAKESFDDFRISDEQKQNVFDSLQGKLARGERLDDRQMKILQILSKDFQIDERKSHDIREDKNNVPVRNGVELQDLHQEQQREVVDHEERDGLEGDKPREEDQLPNPLDEDEEVKDLVEGQQKPGEFDNLGNDRKFEVVDRDQEEPVMGAGGEELKQVVGAAKEDGEKKEGRVVDYEERDIHKGERLDELEKKREGDNPLPKPIQQDDVNLDDEDDYPGAKKDKVEEEDAYGDQDYKRDKEIFQQERLQQKFDRQL